MGVIRHSLMVLLLGTVAVLIGPSIVACGPDLPDEVPDDAAERYAEAICAPYERCGCIGEGFEDVGSCRNEAEALFHEVEHMPHVEFDAECFDRFLEHVEQRGCMGLYDSEPVGSLPCQPFRGTLPSGSACQSDPYREGLGDIDPGSCAGNGRCLGGRCGGPAPEVELGQRCGHGLAVRCGQGRYCSRDGTCHEQVELGQPCDTPAACVLGSRNYCAGARPESDALGECVARIEAEGVCDPQDIGACVLGSSCDRSGVCGDAWPATCHVLTPHDWYDAREWVPER
jgi:hypothetical protein